MWKKLLSLLAAFVLITAAGCSDDDGGGDTDTEDTTGTTEESAPSTTEDEGDDGDALALDDWLEAADEICVETNEVTEDLDLDLSADVEELAEVLEEFAQARRDELEAFEELGLPDEEADTVEELLELLGDAVELFEDAAEATADGDEDGWQVIASEEAEELVGDLVGLAEDLGLEVCGAEEGPDEDPPATTGGDAPVTYGDDPELDALWDACEDGDPDACDDLWDASEYGTEYYDFGFSCGGVVPEGEVEVCSTALGGGSDGPEGGDGTAFTYGDDEVMDALWDACEDGDGEACDDLFWGSPLGSEYEDFGNTCGGRFPEDEVPFSCEAEL